MLLIINIFLCITTQATLYMYDQYIAGFMVIGGFGDGINCMLLEISIWNRMWKFYSLDILEETIQLLNLQFNG